MIQILGCGRSGTHLLANVFEGPDTIVTKEDSRWFQYFLAMARNEARRDRYYQPCVRLLKDQHDKAEAEGKVFVDKTHVAAWFMPDLVRKLPMKTIWIERDPLANIASMIRHRGIVLDVLFYSLSFTVPNGYTGIYGEEWFDEPNIKRFAYKWLSHRKKREELAAWIDYFVRYEDLVRYPEREISKIEEKFGIRCTRPIMRPDSLSKWEKQLPPAAMGMIREVVGVQ